jgi:hypothetical protein
MSQSKESSGDDGEDDYDDDDDDVISWTSLPLNFRPLIYTETSAS